MWMLGISLAALALVIAILYKERPVREGISRAAACKAAVLFLTTADACRAEAETEDSFFAAADQRQWYVKYMDWLYRRGLLSGEMTPPGSRTAEGRLTYEEADRLAEGLAEAVWGEKGAVKSAEVLPETDPLEMTEVLSVAGEVRPTTEDLPETRKNLRGTAEILSETAGGARQDAEGLQEIKRRLTDIVRRTNRNRDKPIPAERFWEMYGELCGMAAESDRSEGSDTDVEPDENTVPVTEEILQIIGTPDNVADAPAWTVYTDQGIYGFEGLGLAGYIDCQIRVLAKDHELIRVMEIVSEEVVCRNVWIVSASAAAITGFAGDCMREFAVEKELAQAGDLAGQLADLQMSGGRVERIALKREKLTAKVLAVREDAIELEGYGEIGLDQDFCVYKTYGEFERQDISRILVGYDTQEFIVADGKICAALIVRSFGAESIRVLITDTGFHSIFHPEIRLEFLSGGIMRQGEKETVFHAGESVVLTAWSGSGQETEAGSDEVVSGISGESEEIVSEAAGQTVEAMGGAADVLGEAVSEALGELGNADDSTAAAATGVIPGRIVLAPSDGRVVFCPADESAGIRVASVTRGQGAPVCPGRLEVSCEESGLVLVNELYMEDYLKRVLPSEMPLSYETEALKAQAVCARTYAYRQIRGNSCRQYGAHVDDSTHYQVYNNSDTGREAAEAVDATYGQILMYGDSAAETYYFSTSCGHTTDMGAWGQEPQRTPYLHAVEVRPDGGAIETGGAADADSGAAENGIAGDGPVVNGEWYDGVKTAALDGEAAGSSDPSGEEAFAAFIRAGGSSGGQADFEASCSMYRWQTRITASQLQENIPDIGRITDVQVAVRGAGGVAQRVIVTGTGGTKEIEGESRIRAALGHPGSVITKAGGSTLSGWESLPSAFLSIEGGTAENGEPCWTIYGGGYGHGIGMSQNGAQAMAKQGWKYGDILDFFYAGTRMETVY